MSVEQESNINAISAKSASGGQKDDMQKAVENKKNCCQPHCKGCNTFYRDYPKSWAGDLHE